MKPVGYYRNLEKLLTLMRDNSTCDLGMSAEGQAIQKKLDDAADAVDQAWADLSKPEQLMFYNLARHLPDNIKPATKEPEKPMIQLLH